jgi:hypothetical protein
MVTNLNTVVIYHGTGVIYRGILTQENGGTAVNYSGIFIALTSVAFQVLHSRVGSWPYPQTLDYAGKACQGQIV